MRIAMVNTMYAPDIYGGAERYVHSLAEGLAATGHEVTVVRVGPRGSARSYAVGAVEVRQVDIANMYWPYDRADVPSAVESAWHLLDVRNPVVALRVGRVLREGGFDVVNTHGLVGMSVSVWGGAAPLPIVHTIHDHRLICVRAAMFRNGSACRDRCTSCRVVSRLKRGPARHVDAVVAATRTVIDRHVEAGFFGDARQVVIPQPVRPSIRTHVERNGALRLGYLGRLHPGKGVEELLAASVGLPDAGWRLDIAGSGEPDFVRSLDALPRHPNVRFRGHVDPADLLPELDALVVPSRHHEGGPLVIGEAFTYGVPVIGADRGNIAELVHEGITGRRFHPDSVDALRAALGDVIADPAPIRAMAGACFAAAVPFALDRVLDAYIDVYRQVAG